MSLLLFYPETCNKDLRKFEKIVIAGIEELIDFFPSYVASNLKVELGKEIDFLSVKLGIDINRELNSYDISLFLEQHEIRNRFIEAIKSGVSKGSLVLVPAVYGEEKS